MARTLRCAFVVGLGLLGSACDKDAEALHDPSDFDPAANISMAKAVEIAEARFPGGFAVAAELDPETAGYEYEVIVFSDGKYWEVEIDTRDGRITAVEEENPADGDVERAEDDAADARGGAGASAPSGPAAVEDANGSPPA